MAIKFGEIDVTQILDNEYQVRVLARIVEWMKVQNPNLKMPDLDELTQIRKAVVEELQTKYPSSDIKYRES